jgi:hypothetical protein
MSNSFVAYIVRHNIFQYVVAHSYIIAITAKYNRLFLLASHTYNTIHSFKNYLSCKYFNDILLLSDKAL